MTTTPLPPPALWHDQTTGHWKVLTKPDRPTYEAYYTAEQVQQARADLEAENQRLLEALERADLFIDEVRQDLHHERIADWYPEGAHSSAAAMSESMRVIGNRCADFEAEAALESRP